MRNRLISTVGTSLLGNLGSNSVYNQNMGISAEEHAQLKSLYQSKSFGRLAKALVKVPLGARVFGAEMNSLNEALQRNNLNLEHLHLLVSDTDDGRQVGELLEMVLLEKEIETLNSVEVHVIDDLQDTKPSRFKIYGLRNLVRQLGKLAQDKRPETLVIDATGGYKAQIAIAVVFGQALGIPVLYKHERFSEIIDFPPMPIVFDYDLLGQNAALLSTFERGGVLTHTEINELDEKVRVLLEETDLDGENIFALSAVGQIFLVGFRARFPRSRQLKPIDSIEKETPKFRDDHYPIGFKDFVNKVWQEVEWIKSAHSIPYGKQKSIKGTGFDVREGKLIGTFQDKNNFGARFEILTRAEGQDQLTWAADQLNQKYNSGN